jgi:hypothetical protein
MSAIVPTRHREEGHYKLVGRPKGLLFGEQQLSILSNARETYILKSSGNRRPFTYHLMVSDMIEKAYIIAGFRP